MSNYVRMERRPGKEAVIMTQQLNMKHKVLIGVCVAAVVALLIMLALSGGNLELLKSIFRQDLSNEELSDQLREFGWRGYFVISALATLQVVCTFLMAEPIQVLGGFAFGFPVGLLCCMIGAALGNTLIYMLQNLFGDRLRGFFVKKLNLDLNKIARSSKGTVIVFILYFLPAIPYGMIAFLAAGMGMSYRRFIAVTSLGALPSVCIGVGLGYMTMESSWIVSLGVFAVLILVVVFMVWKRELLFSKLNGYADKHKKTAANTVRPVNGFLLNLLYIGVRIYMFLCGVRIKTVNRVGKPEAPAIVVCNHGSFIDFIYAAALLRRSKPHFIVARLYFYHDLLAWLLRSIGAFPKSMFAIDLENAKNCLAVLKSGELLAMMPEARLSTTGRFEDIQESTYSFIKRAGVPVYTIKIGGDYFADPKWGKGFRRGSVVEAELDILFTAQQVKELPMDHLKQGILERLTYDEFQWLAQHPAIRYRSGRMAEGLENILTVCPCCSRKYTITTKKNKVFCEECGYLTSVSDRYAFDETFRFANFAQWYDWQMSLLDKEITENEDFSLTSRVELRLPGEGNGLTRHGGYGTCTLNREGLTYAGTRDGETVQLRFSLQKIYRLLFGAGVNFEVYDGTQIFFFVPEEKRSAVDWYMASMLLHDKTVGSGQ